MSNNDYTADDIQVLSDVGHMRKRPSMYIGELTDAHHLFNEAYDNAIDEVQSGYSDRVDVIIDTSSRMYTVRDYGRGIPHGVKKLEDGAIKPIAEVLCTKSFSGGKFDNSNFKISIGLNGLGLVAINSLSNYMKLVSWRADDNRVEGVITSQGKVTEYINDSISDDSPYGTEVTFSPDSSIFTQNDTVPVDFIRDRCRIANAFGVKTHLTIDGVTEEINSDIYDLMPTEDSSPNEFLRHTFRVDDPDTGEYAIVAFKYTSETNCMYRGYTNLLYNSSGGTHHKMIDKSFTDAWNKFNISDIKSSDYFLGLRVVVAVFISDTEYSSQTKEKLTVPKSRFNVLGPKVTEEIYEYLRSNDDIRKGLIKKFQEYRASKNKMLATKEIRSLLYINNDKSDSIRRKSVVRKLVECTSRSREGTELYICLAGDTKVKLLNGTTPCIKDLVGRSPFWIYSIDDQGEFIPALAHDARITQYVTKMIKLTLSDGSTVECTPEHRFLSRDTDDWIEAQDLEIGSSLSHLTTYITSKGYEAMYSPSKRTYIHTHTIVNHLINYSDYEALDKSDRKNYPVTHHKNYNKLDNSPDNLLWSTKYEHIRMHGEHGRQLLTAYNKSQAHKDDMKRAWANPKLREKMANGSHYRTPEGVERARLATKTAHAEGRMHTFKDNPQRASEAAKKLWSDPAYVRRMSEKASAQYAKMNKSPEMKIKQLRGRIGKLIRECLDKYSVFDEEHYNLLRPIHKNTFIRYSTILKYFNSYEEAYEYGKNYNYKVVNIEYIEYERPIPVYCLTVDSDSHAFTLANDLITHNCEGDSARGSVVAARNPVTQAALSIRGKILNVTKMGDIRQCMNNAEVHDIVNSIGAGLFDQCDPAKSRYERVIILADADADGCFTGDTEILMSDGSSVRIDELAKRYSPANPINGLVSTDKYSNKVTAHGIYPRITRWVDHFINLELTDGSVIKCTLDHKFRLADGSYKKAIDLTEDDELLTVKSDESHPVKSLSVKNSSIDIVSRRVPVYDLTVPGYSNFVVKTQGNTGVAVHNCQISMLLLALFINVLPELVKAGMVYIAQPPLYGWKTKSGFEFTNTRSEVPDGIQFTRYKGLGEMDPDEMAYSLLDDNTRMPLLQLQYPDDINQFNQVLTSSGYKYDILYELGLIKYT